MWTLPARRGAPLVGGLCNVVGGRRQNSLQAENEMDGISIGNCQVALWVMNK